MARKTFCKDVATVPPLPSPSLPSEVGPLIAGKGSEERFNGSGRSPAAKRYLVNFRLKISPLVATIFRSFSGNESPNWGAGWQSGSVFLCKQTVWTSQWHGRRFARMWQRFLPSPPIPFRPFRSRPPPIAGRRLGERFSSPSRQTVFGEFQAKNLAWYIIATIFRSFQEMKHQTGGTRWPSGNILVQTKCLDITVTWKTSCKNVATRVGRFALHVIFAWALGGSFPCLPLK